jgi:hypothetical protein
MVACAGLAAAADALGQTTAPSAAQLQARQEVFVMEGILDRAVGYASQSLTRRLAQGPMPDMLLAGVTRTRGFRLEGYGVFFDVEFPVVRESVTRMMWTVQGSPEAAQAVSTALQALSRDLQEMADQSDPRARQELQQRMKAFESQIQPFLVTSTSSGDRITMQGSSVGAFVGKVQDLYTEALRDSLIDAIVDYGAPLGVGSSEWLTVAARASQGRMLLPGDSGLLGGTLMLRVKGSDLAALRDGSVSRDEARKRVEVRQY